MDGETLFIIAFYLSERSDAFSLLDVLEWLDVCDRLDVLGADALS